MQKMKIRSAYGKLGYLLVTLVLLGACAARKTPPRPVGLYQLEGSWVLTSTNDDDSALNGTVVSVDPSSADGIITVLQRNAYCVRPTDVLWKDITTTATGNQFLADNLVNSCTSGLEYKKATLVLATATDLKLTGQAASGKTLLQTWRKMDK